MDERQRDRRERNNREGGSRKEREGGMKERDWGMRERGPDQGERWERERPQRRERKGQEGRLHSHDKFKSIWSRNVALHYTQSSCEMLLHLREVTEKTGSDESCVSSVCPAAIWLWQQHSEEEDLQGGSGLHHSALHQEEPGPHLQSCESQTYTHTHKHTHTHTHTHI